MAETLKHKLSSTIADELINEMMMAGIALILVLAGVNYFGMEWGWLEGVKEAGGASMTTSSTAAAEVTTMINSLVHTFPFKYIFVSYNFWTTVIIAACLTALGLMLKAFTVRTKGKFIIELGKELYIPAIVGFCGIIILQLWTAFNVDDYLNANNLARPEIGDAFLIWNMYGQLFLIGAAILVIGAIIKLVGEKNDAKKMVLVGDTMFNGAFMLIIYYIIIRLISMDVVMGSSAGNMLSIFVLSNHYSNITIAACVFIYTFGKALRRYGISVLKDEKRTQQIDEFKLKYDLMSRQYGARPAAPAASIPHPKELHVQEQHLRQQPVERKHPAHYMEGHPIHRYARPAHPSQQQGKYRKYSN
jgi:hypothetical protein